MRTVFLTGFPGYLASSLLPHLILRSPADTVFQCLVQSVFLDAAERELSRMPADLRSRVRLFEGDITQGDLGLGADTRTVTKDCTDIFHFAAVYDLSVSRELSFAVNVDGTRHVLEIGSLSAHIPRFHHVSTCYVSGDFSGTFLETDLDVGQGFRNYYEETKFLSEKLVHESNINDCRATIYRPSIVAGNSSTGAAKKQDGLYFFIQWLLAQPRVFSVMPQIANPDMHRFNVVPSDFVVQAIAFLSRLPSASGTVYQLCDPNPPTIRELLRLLSDSTGHRVVGVWLPTLLAKKLLRTICYLKRDLDIPAEAIDYLAHEADYDATSTFRDLAGSGIQLPSLATYVGRMVDFVRTTSGSTPADGPDA